MKVRLDLTFPQALALQALVGVAQGLCEGEPDFIRLYRTPAAERASEALDEAIRKARR